MKYNKIGQKESTYRQKEKKTEVFLNNNNK